MSDGGGVVEIVVQFDDGACLNGDLHVDYLPAETGPDGSISLGKTHLAAGKLA